MVTITGIVDNGGNRVLVLFEVAACVLTDQRKLFVAFHLGRSEPMTEGTCPRCQGSGEPRALFEVAMLDGCIRCGGTGRAKNPTEPTDDFRIAVMEAEQRAYERGYADGRGHSAGRHSAG